MCYITAENFIQQYKVTSEKRSFRRDVPTFLAARRALRSWRPAKSHFVSFVLDFLSFLNM